MFLVHVYTYIYFFYHTINSIFITIHLHFILVTQYKLLSQYFSDGFDKYCLDSLSILTNDYSGMREEKGMVKLLVKKAHGERYTCNIVRRSNLLITLYL